MFALEVNSDTRYIVHEIQVKEILMVASVFCGTVHGIGIPFAHTTPRRLTPVIVTGHVPVFLTVTATPE